MSDSAKSADETEQLACPIDGCENEELDETPEDPEYDYFCHWCGNLFEAGEADA